ncbi:location of vulva defective 1 [Drosophila serrata]|uniref:location of vulva defective 1 n=1 Tax=Drosophila serrata TaxID=7274 RepID=UPI000A1CF53F|nr:location of vulva defective 1 [Drosophila serrata]XP_020803097.1 location of vulva defective 1 [Drosophila serrata]
MVNELNRPQNGENAALSERLAASNRQLQEMQEEHRELLQEMETLRLRAAELTVLNAQRHQQRQSVRMVQEETVTSQVQSSQVEASQVEAVTEQSSTSSVDTPTEETAPETQEEEEDKEETASYLQQKLNEIAQLKAQFKRVQHMVDTTKMIEEHMSTRQTTQISSSSTSSRQSTTSEVRVAATESEEATEGPSSSQSTPADNAELLNTMLNMFTDFTSDLRGQAESLREERDRIKALKEEIIQRKQGK